MQPSSPIKRPGRWLWRPRISLRWLLILVALVSLVFSGVASVRHAYEKDRAARETLNREAGFTIDTSSILPDWVFDYIEPERLIWFDRATYARSVVQQHENGQRIVFGFLTGSPTSVSSDTAIRAFSRIVDCPHLTELYIECLPLTDIELSVIGGLHRLEWLEISTLAINGDSLSVLKRFPRLRVLGIYDCALQPESLANVAALNRMERLWLANLSVGTSLRDMDGSRLRELSLNSANINDEVSKLLVNCPELESLELMDNGISDQVVAPLAHAGKLDYLNLSNTRVAGTTLDRLRNCPLRGLILRGSEIDDAGAARIAQLHSLEYIDIAYTNVTAVGLARIATLPKLYRLDASYVDLDPAVVAGIEFSSSIRELRLQKTGIDDQCIDRFLKMASLKELDVRDCPISDDGKTRLKAAIQRVDVGKSPN